MVMRSVLVRVVVCCGLVAGALLLELHYNLATYIQQVQYSTVQYSTVQYTTKWPPTPSRSPPLGPRLLSPILCCSKLKRYMHMYCEAQRMVCLGFSRLGILIQLSATHFLFWPMRFS